MATLVKELHPKKAHCAMLATDDGMVTLFDERHSWKLKHSLRCWSPSHVGMATLANELHPRKAYRSMRVTDEGMATRANAQHLYVRIQLT